MLITIYLVTTLGVFLLCSVFFESTGFRAPLSKRQIVFLVVGVLLLLVAIAVLAAEIMGEPSNLSFPRLMRRVAGEFTLMFLLGVLSGVLIFDALHRVFPRKNHTDALDLLKHPTLYVVLGSVALTGVVTSIETPIASIKLRVLEEAASVDRRKLSFSEPRIRAAAIKDLRVLFLEKFEPIIKKDISFYKLFPEEYRTALDERELARVFTQRFWGPLATCLQDLNKHFEYRELTHELSMPASALMGTLRIAQEYPDRDLSTLSNFPDAMSKMWTRLAKFHERIMNEDDKKANLGLCPDLQSTMASTKANWPEEFSKAEDLDQTVVPRMFLALMMDAIGNYEGTMNVLLGEKINQNQGRVPFDKEDSEIYKKFAYDFNYLQLIIYLQEKAKYPKWYTVEFQEDRLRAIQAFEKKVASRNLCKTGARPSNDCLKTREKLLKRYRKQEAIQKNRLAYIYAIEYQDKDWYGEKALSYIKSALEYAEKKGTVN